MRIREAQREAAIRWPGLDVRIAPDDAMLPGPPSSYFWAGASALDQCLAAVRAAGQPEPHAVLDLPCGHGRVLRHIKRQWPTAAITACDLDRSGVDFCASRFGAFPVYSDTAIESVEVGGPFDLIFVGSLFTHLAADRWPRFLRFFVSHLAPTGVLVVTTHGERSLAVLNDTPVLEAPELALQNRYGLSDDEATTVVASYESGGFGFAGPPDYGISVSAPAWVRGQLTAVGLREAWFSPHGWGGHQDVFACLRSGQKVRSPQ